MGWKVILTKSSKSQMVLGVIFTTKEGGEMIEILALLALGMACLVCGIGLLKGDKRRVRRKGYKRWT